MSQSPSAKKPRACMQSSRSVIVHDPVSQCPPPRHPVPLKKASQMQLLTDMHETTHLTQSQSSGSLLQLSHQLLVQFLQVAVLMLNARLVFLQTL